MNDDKPSSVETKCPTCDIPMEYTDGNTRCLCHECGSQWDYRLKDDSTLYPTVENPIQEMSIRYDSSTTVFPKDMRGKKLTGEPT